MSKKGKDVVVEEKALRGRSPKEDRSQIVLPNNLYVHQWEWIKQEAANKVPPVDAAWHLRFIVQNFIDAVEASRADIKDIVTPRDDETFEQSITSSKNTSSRRNKNGK